MSMGAYGVAVSAAGSIFDMIGAAIQGQPKLPDFQRLNPQQEQNLAIQGNINELPALENLASGVNTFNRQQLEQMLRTAMPWFDSVRAQAGDIIQSELRGEIPEDVQRQIQDSDAARALGGGYGGSGMHADLFARDLGLTSLSLTEKGLSSAESWIQEMDNIYKQGQFDLTKMFLSPAEQFQMDQSERDRQFQHDWASNILSWEGSPSYLIGGSLEEFGHSLASMGGGAFGGAAGTKAAGGGGGGSPDTSVPNVAITPEEFAGGAGP